MGDGGRLAFGEETGERWGEGEVVLGSTGELKPPVGIQCGDVARRIGDAALRGLVAGDNTNASIWLLGGILIGGGLNFLVLKRILCAAVDPVDCEREPMDFLGLVSGEPAGLECGEVGTRVSELVVSCTYGLVDSDPIPTSVSEDAPEDIEDSGTVRQASPAAWSRPADSSRRSGSSRLKVILVVLLGVTVTAACSSSPESEDSDSVTSVRKSFGSDRVSHEAIGASFCLGGMSRVVVSGSSALELDRSPESCRSSETV